MRVDVFIKLVLFDIEIDTRNIIARFRNNNFFYFHIWKKRKSTMILFNFELLMTMLMSKQHDIKFVITKKIFNIKLALLYITSKNDIINKKRFNLIDKLIFKSQYFDVFFDSNSIFNSNFDAFRKISIDTLNL